MTQQEIKNDIAELKATIAITTDADEKAMLEEGLKELESMLSVSKDEPKGASKKSKSKTKRKTVTERSRSQKKTKPEPTPVSKDEPKGASPKKVILKAKPVTKDESTGASKTASKDEPSGASLPVKKKLILKKEKKEETHTIETSFGKDIKDAILVLNKERFKIREIKDKKTGKTEQVKHSVEYRNAKTIQNRVNSIFDSAVYDIARTPQDKKAKKDIIEVVNDIRDLHSLWLNEIDIIIANEEQKDLEKIRTLMLNLMKEARKNDVDNKWRNAGGLEEMAKKFSL